MSAALGDWVRGAWTVLDELSQWGDWAFLLVRCCAGRTGDQREYRISVLARTGQRLQVGELDGHQIGPK